MFRSADNRQKYYNAFLPVKSRAIERNPEAGAKKSRKSQLTIALPAGLYYNGIITVTANPEKGGKRGEFHKKRDQADLPAAARRETAERDQRQGHREDLRHQPQLVLLSF